MKLQKLLSLTFVEPRMSGLKSYLKMLKSRGWFKNKVWRTCCHCCWNMGNTFGHTFRSKSCIHRGSCPHRLWVALSCCCYSQEAGVHSGYCEVARIHFPRTRSRQPSSACHPHRRSQSHVSASLLQEVFMITFFSTTIVYTSILYSCNPIALKTLFLEWNIGPFLTKYLVGT